MLTEDQLEKIREERNKTRVAQSLMELAIKAVGKHCTRFIDNPDSSLKNLPNTVVQRFLAMISCCLGQFNIDQDPEKLLIPMPLLSKVMIQLMNPSVTEINCTNFDGEMTVTSREYNNILLEHALKNCPKISKFQMSTKDITLVSLFLQHHCLLPVERFKQGWNDLKSIVCGNEYICYDYTLKFIQQNYPNIEELSISANSLSQTCVEHLKNMKKLHTLHFDESLLSMEANTPDWIIAVAGEVASLRNFDFRSARNHNQFINRFAQKYPQKQLLVKNVVVESGVTEKWPKNLSVSRLQIIGSLCQSDIENLSSIACEFELNMECVDAVQMHKLLERIGHLVKGLGIGDTESRVEGEGRPIELQRILASCPNLERFNYDTYRKVVQDKDCNLQPAAFKNYRSLSIQEDIVALDEECCRVFNNFLIGTKVCEEVEIKDYKQLQLLAEVALTHPNSLQKLRQVKNGPYVHLAIRQVFNPAERLRLWNVFCKSILQVLTCCPSLEKVVIAGDQNVLKMSPKPKENCYLATIKSIDPNMIEFRAPGFKVI